jgi:ATP synthase protein I
MANHDDFKTRLKIAKKRLKISSENHGNNQNSSSMGSAFKLSTDLVAHVAVGTIIGFILDSWFDTKPWLIIIFFFLGSVAGILNVIKTAKQMQEKDKF